ncbi:DUF2971 domain-containing protein [Thalassomonas viridans]|uniref:DUF2971 domain-containing protein n=1 Tax=Thalassomonas viridans TaxID=137584 RepID=A0AAE9Z7U2_9GAMM|nr:DUF2971 domain-containing protein [Thalassomonas viridans]WDE07852.1 DUF2971 domain-containing protein [Thalassomonas viridans]
MNLELGAKFLNAPMIRLSNQSCLNDPFEFLLSSTSSSKVEQALRKSLGKDYDHSELIHQFWTHGIVSLTETHDNLLMWSHYADEHRGMVIGFDIPQASPFEFFLDAGAGVSAGKGSHFHKVNYRKFRQFSGEINASNLDEVRLHYMLSKSDEWIYEKEHRFVIPFDEADIILLSHKSELFSRVLDDLQLPPDALIPLEYEEKSLIDLRVHAVPKAALFKLWCLSGVCGAMFFKLVNPNAIKNIYLGRSVAPESLSDHICSNPNKAIRERFNDPETGEVTNVFKASLDNDRYELNFAQCYLSLLDYMN